ncbi:MAG: alpha,alpha-trehalase [Ignavibacteria bacterium]|nr:alpha,alpha-trehalase [Ignavibacteria bacterium]
MYEPPLEKITRSIRELFWDGLTRRIDEQGLAVTIADEKTSTTDGMHYLYVPHDDTAAFRYFSGVGRRHPEWRMNVVALPGTVTADYVRGLDGYHGLLSLSLQRGRDGTLSGAPFVVPGGRFNEMYGWDSYFIVLGLLEDGRIETARSMVDHFVYEIENYGAILNANRSYYLTRSQPPFLTSMARAVYGSLPDNEATRVWLKRVLEASIREYRGVWTNEARMTRIGLSRYFDSGYGPPPEVEPGHFDVVFSGFAGQFGMEKDRFESAYRARKLSVPALDEYFVHDRAMRESGHDTSYRLEGVCADLVTVDLNTLLFKIETDIADLLDSVFTGSLVRSDSSVETSSAWRARAQQRKELVNRYLWDDHRGSFFDYNLRTSTRIDYVSATCLYPLWGRLASSQQAEEIVHLILPLLEVPGGVVSSAEKSRGPITPDRPLRQWDYPYGWAPHQILVWQGLKNYGYDDAAARLAYRWLYTITRNAADYAGTVPEKFDLVNRTHRVFAEYGNVGTEFSYITREGFGWTNASFQIGLRLLSPELKARLNRLVPPEWIFIK